MFNNKDKVAIWMEGSLDDDYGKMAFRIYKETNVKPNLNKLSEHNVCSRLQEGNHNTLQQDLSVF